MTVTVPEEVLWMTAQPEPSMVMLETLIVSWEVVRYVPQGKRRVAPLVRAPMALLMAAVSLVYPLPVAPNADPVIVVVAAPVPVNPMIPSVLLSLLATATVPIVLPPAGSRRVT